MPGSLRLATFGAMYRPLRRKKIGTGMDSTARSIRSLSVMVKSPSPKFTIEDFTSTDVKLQLLLEFYIQSVIFFWLQNRYSFYVKGEGVGFMADKMDNLAVGLRIRNLRESKGLTREDIINLSGVSAQFLSAIEHGTKSMKIQTLRKLATALDVSTDFIVYGCEQQPESWGRSTNCS